MTEVGNLQGIASQFSACVSYDANWLNFIGKNQLKGSRQLVRLSIINSSDRRINTLINDNFRIFGVLKNRLKSWSYSKFGYPSFCLDKL